MKIRNVKQAAEIFISQYNADLKTVDSLQGQIVGFICANSLPYSWVQNLTIEVLFKQIPDVKKQYSINEAIADTGLIVGASGLITAENSRNIVDYVIVWAKEFETANDGVEWGVDSDIDYLDSLQVFVNAKIEDTINRGFGYIEKQTDTVNAETFQVLKAILSKCLAFEDFSNDMVNAAVLIDRLNRDQKSAEQTYIVCHTTKSGADKY